MAGLNFGVWAFLHYFGNAYYSYISWETIRDNIRDGWEWDRSRYFVNFYHHPYHGYLYYSAGRANGLDFWGSSVAALGGSFMWEMMMEKYRPSINDLITTTAGGIVFGEIGYRFSALVRKRDARGLGRIWREAVGAVLDPVGGANRLLNGRNDTYPGLPGSPDVGRILNGELMLTGPVVTRSAELTGTRAAPLLGFTLRYGDPAGTGWTGRPFDVFTVAGRLRWGPDRPHLSLFIHGALLGRTFAGTQRRVALPRRLPALRILRTRYDARLRHVVHGRLVVALRVQAGVRLSTSARLGWLGLGASDDFYGIPGRTARLQPRHRRDGGRRRAVAAKGFEYVTLIWRHYDLFDLDVIGSRVGRETWDILQGQLEFPVWSRFGIGIEAEYCARRLRLQGFRAGQPEPRRGPGLRHVAVLERRSTMKEWSTGDRRRTGAHSCVAPLLTPVAVATTRRHPALRGGARFRRRKGQGGGIRQRPEVRRRRLLQDGPQDGHRDRPRTFQRPARSGAADLVSAGRMTMTSLLINEQLFVLTKGRLLPYALWASASRTSGTRQTHGRRNCQGGISSIVSPCSSEGA